MNNDSNSFINYTDPTKPLDFDYADGIIHEVSLKDSYDNLSDNEKLMVRSLYNNPPIRLIASGPQSTGAILYKNHKRKNKGQVLY